MPIVLQAVVRMGGAAVHIERVSSTGSIRCEQAAAGWDVTVQDDSQRCRTGGWSAEHQACLWVYVGRESLSVCTCSL